MKPEVINQDNVPKLLKIDQTKAHEIALRITVAQGIPRNLKVLKENLIEILEDKDIRENAYYKLPRAGKIITGLNIKIIRELAREFMHLSYGSGRSGNNR